MSETIETTSSKSNETTLNNNTNNNTQLSSVEDDINKYNNKDYLDEDDMSYPPKFYLVSLISPENVMNTQMRTFKIRKFRGRLEYSSYEEADRAAIELQAIDKYSHIFVGEGGKWMAWDPEAINVEKEMFRDKDQQRMMDAVKVKEHKMKELNALVGKTKDMRRQERNEYKSRKKQLLREGLNEKNTPEFNTPNPEQMKNDSSDDDTPIDVSSTNNANNSSNASNTSNTQNNETTNQQAEPKFSVNRNTHNPEDIKNKLRNIINKRNEQKKKGKEGALLDEEYKKEKELNELKKTYLKTQSASTKLEENLDRIKLLIEKEKSKQTNK